MVRKLYIHDSFKVKTLSSHRDLDLPEDFNHFFTSTDYNVLWIWGIPQIKDSGRESVCTKLSKIVHKNDCLIFDVSTEAFPLEVAEKYQNYFKNKSIFLQSGLNTITSHKTIYHPGFFRPDYSDTITFADRNHKYSALSRLLGGRNQRLIFTYQLFRQGILKDGLVSCGSGIEDSEFTYYKDNVKTMSKEFTQKLPLLVDGPRVNRFGNDQQQISSHHNQVNNPGKDAVINVVLESAIDAQASIMHPELTYKNGWSTNFFTEKTAKMFNCKQLPLFVAPFGYVARLRELGFDVFDDIIDHNYDTVPENDARICMVVDELKRLIQKDTFESIVSSYQNIEHRLNNNRINIEKTGTLLYDMYFKKLKTFINSSKLPTLI